MPSPLPVWDVPRIYARFAAEMTPLDCGKFCSLHNPNAKPFCCDICQAVPAVYVQEWEYLQEHTDLWHVWRGDECAQDLSDPSLLLSETAAHMLLLACQGPSLCQRQYRSLSCRQFPFFPYISTDYRFIGLACEWVFEQTCWVIHHLEAVTAAYRAEFVQTCEFIFSVSQDDFANYAVHSDRLREFYERRRRCFPLLHRNGKIYYVSPVNERLYEITQVQDNHQDW